MQVEKTHTKQSKKRREEKRRREEKEAQSTIITLPHHKYLQFAYTRIP
jgi:hypothetical protein